MDEMHHQAPHGRGRLAITKVASTLGIGDPSLEEIDPDGPRSLAAITVTGHWLVSVVCVVELVYRPYYGAASFAAYGSLILVLIGFTGWLHYRLRTHRSVWRWLQTLYVVDLVLISIAVAMSGGFSHPFLYVFYFPVVAAFAVILPSLRIAMVWVTMVSVVYVVMSVTVGDGLDLEARDEKALLARLGVMYIGVMTVNMASTYERERRHRAVERERAIERERLELSQNIHDTTAQFAYMIGLGIDTARALAGGANRELTAALEESSRLSRSTMWGLRHPIDLGGIFKGHELGRALDSHLTSFTNVTAVPAELKQTGVEPPLPVGTKGALFSIAHNALTNAYRHAQASRVSVELDYREGLRLSVSDDGAGLPDDYAEQGHGFPSMIRDAERLGGTLRVERTGRMGGATVTCEVPPAEVAREEI